MKSIPKKHPGGRPRKFQEPSHPITVTLPNRTLELLASIDHDRAKAIARAADMALPTHVPPQRLVEIIEVAERVGLLVTPPSRYLKKIRLLRMVEVAPSRFLLTVPSGTALAELEVAVSDMLDEIPRDEARERAIIKEVLTHMQRLRRADQITKAEILVVAL